MPGYALLLWRRFALALIAAAATFVFIAQSMLPPSAAASAAIRNAASSRGLGVSVGGPFMNRTDAELRRELDALKTAGVSWIRMDIDWSAVEPQRGRRNFDRTDRVIAAVRARGMKVLGIITYTPGWAQASPSGNSHTPPADPALFAAFAADVAKRYQPQGVTTWEIWNEPNLPNFWAPKPDPESFTNLVRQTSGAIRRAVPEATVLSGGLAPAVNASDGSTVAPETFLRRAYAAGLRGSVQAVAVHPYSYPALAYQPGTDKWNTFMRLGLVRQVMDAAGDSGVPIWLTEFGSPTGSSAASVSESDQWKILLSGLENWSSTPGLGPLFIYNGRDAAANPGDPEMNFGLLRADFTRKPAYDGLVSLSLTSKRRSTVTVKSTTTWRSNTQR